VAQELDDDARRRLAVLALVLEDARFREQVLGAGANLGAVAREYARAIYRVPSGDQTEAWMVERTLEIEDLCLLLSLRAGGERLPRAGAILVGERVSAFSALAAVAARGAGFALGGPAEEGSLGVAIARAAGLAVVAEVAGLFAWIRPGDRLLLDGETGVVRVNPPASAVARFRRRLE
jgi:phosphoenolpyruvate-protein kinase (PTS system EI component)